MHGTLLTHLQISALSVALGALLTAGLAAVPATSEAAESHAERAVVRAVHTRHPAQLARRLSRQMERGEEGLECAYGLSHLRATGDLRSPLPHLSTCDVDVVAPLCETLLPVLPQAQEAVDAAEFARWCGDRHPDSGGHVTAAMLLAGLGLRARSVNAEILAITHGFGRMWPDGRDGVDVLLALGPSPAEIVGLLAACDRARVLRPSERVAWARALGALHRWSEVLPLLDAAPQSLITPQDTVLRARALNGLGRWVEAESVARPAWEAKTPSADAELARAIGEQALLACDAQGLARVEAAWRDGLDGATLQLAAGCVYERTPMSLQDTPLRKWLPVNRKLSHEAAVLDQVNQVRRRVDITPLETPNQSSRALSAYLRCQQLDPSEARCDVAAFRLGLTLMYTLDYSPGASGVSLTNESRRTIRVDLESGETAVSVDIAPGSTREVPLPSGPIFVFASCNANVDDRTRMRDGRPITSMFQPSCSVPLPDSEGRVREQLSLDFGGLGYWLVADLLPPDSTLHWRLVE